MEGNILNTLKAEAAVLVTGMQADIEAKDLQSAAVKKRRVNEISKEIIQAAHQHGRATERARCMALLDVCTSNGGGAFFQNLLADGTTPAEAAEIIAEANGQQAGDLDALLGGE